MRWIAGFVLVCVAASAGAADANNNSDAPKVGTAAPALSFTQLLQAPPGAKADWPSLKGKVVVLEFWATWCVPCVAEIPVMNSLVAGVDPAKVQFISVDDEDPATVEPFLKKHPISGLIGLDTTGKVYERFGVEARPTTMVIDPAGKVVSTTVHPEELKAEQLVALADGKPVTLGGEADAKVQAALDEAIKKGFAAEVGATADSAKALFSITLSPGEPAKDGQAAMTRMVSQGPGEKDILNASVQVLLNFGAGMATTRLKMDGKLPETNYNLHIAAPGADAKQLAAAVELAISTGAGVKIVHQTTEKDAYVLVVGAGAKEHFVEAGTDAEGHRTLEMAFYDEKKQNLQCMTASADQLAEALEHALGMPVVNETGLTGRLAAKLTIVPKDFASAEKALEENAGLKLVPAKRMIETVTLSPVAKPGAAVAAAK
jgi:uncharacterized protein (TIGR03435 family)